MLGQVFKMELQHLLFVGKVTAVRTFKLTKCVHKAYLAFSRRYKLS